MRATSQEHVSKIAALLQLQALLMAVSTSRMSGLPRADLFLFVSCLRFLYSNRSTGAVWRTACGRAGLRGRSPQRFGIGNGRVRPNFTLTPFFKSVGTKWLKPSPYLNARLTLSVILWRSHARLPKAHISSRRDCSVL